MSEKQIFKNLNKKFPINSYNKICRNNSVSIKKKFKKKRNNNTFIIFKIQLINLLSIIPIKKFSRKFQVIPMFLLSICMYSDFIPSSFFLVLLNYLSLISNIIKPTVFITQQFGWKIHKIRLRQFKVKVVIVCPLCKYVFITLNMFVNKFLNCNK